MTYSMFYCTLVRNECGMKKLWEMQSIIWTCEKECEAACNHVFRHISTSLKV